MLHPLPLDRAHGDPIIQIQGLSCGYQNQQVLSGVTLEIMQGDFVGFVGPSGSGKTTLRLTMPYLIPKVIDIGPSFPGINLCPC